MRTMRTIGTKELDEFIENLDAFALAVDEVKTTSAELSKLAATAAELVNLQAQTDLAGAKRRAAYAEKELKSAQAMMYMRFESAAKMHLGKKPHWLESKQKFFERVTNLGEAKLAAALQGGHHV